MKRWMIVPAAVAAVVLGAAAHAGFGGGGGLHAHFAKWLHGGSVPRIDAHLDAMAARLELTAEQRKDVAGVLRARLPDLERDARALATAHVEQIELVHAAELDEAAVRAAAVRIGAAEGELAVGVARLLRDAHAVLTPEQRARAAASHPVDLRAHVAAHLREASERARAWADRQ